MNEYPEIQAKLTAGELQPGLIMMGTELVPIWNVPYSHMVKEFEEMGATRMSQKAS